MAGWDAPRRGGCSCGAIRYRVDGAPITVYCCHCTDCQRLYGTAFGWTMVLRRAQLVLEQGAPDPYDFTFADGRRRRGTLCVRCATRLWGEPADPARAAVLSLRPGTLDDPRDAEPALHIWVRSRQPWVTLPADVPAFETQPDDPTVFGALWRERAQRSAR